MSGRDIRYDAVGEGSRHKSSWVSGRSRTGERGRDRHHRDFKSGGDDRRRDKNYKYDREGIRDHDRTDRHRDYNRDKERRHRHRSRSHSSDRFRNRSKSLSPSRSPSKSKRRSGFDMAPPAAAMLPGAAVPGQLPGVPSAVPEMAQNMLPFGATQLGAFPLMPVQVMTQQATRHARRVYVGGLPPLANEQAIATFFSQVMTAIGGNSAGPGDAVVNVYINHEKKFAFVEMRTVEEASNAMALDGIIFEGVAVRVRRPTDYNPTLAAALGPGQPSPNLNLAAVGLASGAIGGAEGPDRVFVGGLPYYFTETQIKELLESFGTLHGFDLVKDRDTGNSKGYGFCVYQDPAVTDIACAALNGLKMGDKTLTVRRATASSGQSKTEQESILAQAQQHIAIQKMALQTSGMNTLGGGMSLFGETLAKVLCLTEAITADALADDEEYEEILEDMREECGKYEEKRRCWQYSTKAALAYVPPENPNSVSQRWFCGLHNVYCMFMGSLNNLSSLNKQYGLSKGSNEAMFVIEAYRTLRDRGPYPAHQVLRDLDGSFGFVLYDCKAGTIFAALDADEGVRLFWGIAADGSVVISDNLELIKASCAKSFAPFPAGMSSAIN